MSDVALSWHLQRPRPGWARRLDVHAVEAKRHTAGPARLRRGLAVLVVLALLVAFCRRREVVHRRPSTRLTLHVSPRPRTARLRAIDRHIRRLLVCTLGATTLMLAVGSGLLALPKPPPMPVAPPPSVWREILKPVRIWSLESPEFAGLPLDYRARVHLIGGGREDVMTLGRFDGAAASLRLRLFRRASEPPVAVPLPEALAGEASRLGLTLSRSGKMVPIETRYGRLEIADVRLSRTPSDLGQACAGFRLIRETPSLSISGLVCGRHGARMSRDAVGCLVERLDVASARDDRELIDFVAASELQRNAACAGARLRPDTLHAPWLDDKTEVPAPTFVSVGGNSATGGAGLRRR